MLAAATGLSVRRPVVTVMLFLALAVGMLAWTVAEVRINTSNTDMLSKDLPFRQDAIAFSDAFPALSGNIVITVDAATTDAAEDAARNLAEALLHRGGVEWVFYDRADPFLRRNGLLYLSLPELENLADDLSAAQPLLAKLNAQPDFRGLADVFGLAVEEGDAAARASIAPALDRMAAVIAGVADGNERPLSWTALLADEAEDADTRQVIIAQPVLDFSSLSPAGSTLDTVREFARYMEGEGPFDLRVGITGSAALEEEELASVRNGMGLVGLISLVLVLLLLFAAYRSAGAVLATLVVLIAGLCITAGLATIVVGQFNLISVAFAVLFIGLGVDFNLHYILRGKEEGALADDRGHALRVASRSGGPALVLCAISSAVAFFSFTPTDYRGVAELGLIAGMGMFVAVTLSLTMLPALLMLIRPRHVAVAGGGGLLAPVARFSIRHSHAVLVLAAILFVGGATLAPGVGFDDDPMNLRDPDAQSVRVARELMADPDRQTYAIDIMAADRDAAQPIAERLATLDTVSGVRTIADLLPDEQEEKLFIIQDLAFILGPMMAQERAKPITDPDIRRAAALELRGHVASAEADFGAAGSRLLAALDRVMDDPRSLERAELMLMAGLDGRLKAIFDAVGAEQVELETLPPLLRSFWLASDSRARIEVLPKADMSDAAARDAFVEQVRAVAPDATGTPLIIADAGDAVVTAFAQALLYAAVAVLVLLLFMLRNLLDVLIVAIPALVGAVLTAGAMRLTGLSFNFANIIVLPLLFGLSVDFGIHIVMRARDVALENLYAVSTMRAILYSAATTVGSFAALSLSPHEGTASMGLLLTIALSATILAALVVTPALLRATARWRHG